MFLKLYKTSLIKKNFYVIFHILFFLFTRYFLKAHIKIIIFYDYSILCISTLDLLNLINYINYTSKNLITIVSIETVVIISHYITAVICPMLSPWVF